MAISFLNMIFNSYQLLYSGLALGCLFTFTWIISIFKQDVSIDQHIWGLGFAFQALIYYLESPELTWQKSLFTFLTLFHTLRLSTYIFIREYGRPEDKRYQLLLRDKLGNHLTYLSLFIIFIPQMIANWLIGLSLFTFEVSKAKDTISNIYFLFAACVMIMGTLIESLADIQLYFFKQDKRNEGKIMDRGLWKYSRHPNYFGECLFWWGVFFANWSIGFRITIFAPLLMHVITRFFTGVPLTEKAMEKEFGQQKMKDYQEKTSPLIPGPQMQQQANQGQQANLQQSDQQQDQQQYHQQGQQHGQQPIKQHQQPQQQGAQQSEIKNF
jgi:steroid 5-alpha reductase family enzyme